MCGGISTRQGAVGGQPPPARTTAALTPLLGAHHLFTTDAPSAGAIGRAATVALAAAARLPMHSQCQQVTAGSAAVANCRLRALSAPPLNNS